MKLLAIDTSSPACCVSLSVGSAVFERHEEQAREHTRLITPMIRSVLSEGGVALSDLDAIVLGNGPGSFIGMRIAASVAQGLAHGAGLCIVPVSSLAAVAAEGGESASQGGMHVIVAADDRAGAAAPTVFAARQDVKAILAGEPPVHCKNPEVLT